MGSFFQRKISSLTFMTVSFVLNKFKGFKASAVYFYLFISGRNMKQDKHYICALFLTTRHESCELKNGHNYTVEKK